MRKVLTSALTIVFCLAVVAGAAYAYFSSKTTISGNVLGTGSAVLAVGNSIEPWVEFPKIEVSNTYPGWNKTYPIYFRNDSTVDITLKIRPAIGSTSGDDGLLDEIKMGFTNPDGASIGPWTLRAWSTADDNPSLTTLAHGVTTGEWKVNLSIPLSATIQGASLTFDLLFEGIQVP